MKTGRQPRGRLVITGEPWETYVRMLRIFNERRHLRITYDRGLLEIMTLSPEHEGYKHLIGRFVIVLTEELGLPLAAYGSLTFKRRRKSRGLEPDECYWIKNEALVRTLILMRLFKPQRHPPPDLVVEVDIESSSANRMGIYQVMRVPEVWQHDGKVLRFLILGAGGYQPSDESLAFPGLKAADLAPFLAMCGQTDTNAIMRQFRAWVQARIAAGWK